MAEPLIEVVSMWIHQGQEADFEAFEREAARRMARHGGRIDLAIRTNPRAQRLDRRARNLPKSTLSASRTRPRPRLTPTIRKAWR